MNSAKGKLYCFYSDCFRYYGTMCINLVEPLIFPEHSVNSIHNTLLHFPKNMLVNRLPTSI